MDVFIAGISIITILVVLWSLWTRRLTWRYKWESANTVAVAFMALAMFLLAPPGEIISHALWGLTHVANLQFFISHLCGLGVGSALVFSAKSKLCPENEDPDDYYRRIFRPRFVYRIQVPVWLGILTMFALFAGSRRQSHCDPHWMEDPINGPYLAGYWIVFSVLVIYLMGHLIHALMHLREDKDGRILVDLYLIAAVLTTATQLVHIAVAIFLNWQNRGTAACMWIASTVGVILFAVGAALSWMNRVRWFTDRPGWGGLAIPRFRPGLLRDRERNGNSGADL